MNDGGHEAFVLTGVRHTVKEATSDKYLAALANFVNFIDERRLPFELTSFVRFLHACRKQGAAGSTLSGYRAAVLWAQRAFDTPQWAANDVLVRAIKGYKYADKLSRKPRGAILTPMLVQLETRYPHLAVPAALVYYCVLRRKQAERALVGDAQFMPDGRVVLTVRAEKRSNANNNVQTVTRKEVVLPEGQAILRALVKGRKPGEKMLPGFKADVLDRAIAETALAMGWPTDLEYDGMHCLRHGGATALREFFTRLFASMGNPAAMSPTTAAWYSRLNVLRSLAEREEKEALAEEEEEGEGEVQG